MRNKLNNQNGLCSRYSSCCKASFFIMKYVVSEEAVNILISVTQANEDISRNEKNKNSDFATQIVNNRKLIL